MAGNKRGRGKLHEISPDEDADKCNKIRQEQEQQRQLRNGYQLLSARVKEAGTLELCGVDENLFKAILLEADKLSERAARPREQLQDADLLETLSATLKNEVKKLQQHDGRSPDDFVAGLCRQFQRGGIGGGSLGEEDDDAGPSEHSFNWAGLGKEHALRYSRPAVSFGTMLGPMSAEAPKGRVVSQRRRRDQALGVTVTPEEAGEQAMRDDQQRDRETEARVRSLFKAIRKSRPGTGGVPLLPLIVDPGCFTRSVENVFALSFLVKDGRCQLNAAPPPPGASPLECMLVEPKNAPSEEDRSRGLHENTQFIMRLDYSDWLNLKEGVQRASSGHAVPDSQPVSTVI